MLSVVKNVLFIFFIVVVAQCSKLKAQTPTTCFEIESILVDACGTIEGENEMVRFRVGPNNLNVNNLNVNWPNNPFKNFCKNSSTANKVALLNSSIVGCGRLKEPTSNILPAGARVMILTSTNFDVSANSFANLNDTLYVIFQCSGNTAGHFANYNSTTSTRTLSMSFSSPGGCFDVVTYDRALLVDQSGTQTTADGSRVDFAWNGTASYANNGCAAPIINNSVDILNTGATICQGDTINLTSMIIGNLSNIQWSGGNGSFSSNSNSSTNYFSSVADIANFYIFLSGTTTCGDLKKDSVLVQVGANTTNVNITSSTNVLCSGDSLLLTAAGTGNYLWNTGSNASSIYVSSPGIYSVSSITSCGNASANIVITASPTINLNLSATSTQICSGSFSTLTSSGAQSYLWFDGSVGSTVQVQNTGNYYVIGYNNCYRDSQSVFINVTPTPSVSITSSSPTLEICVGQSISLTASGSGNYLWNTGDTSSIIVILTAGTYSVTSSNACFSSFESITIGSGNLPSIAIVGDTIWCKNQVINLTAISTGNVTWSNGSQNQSTSFNSSGLVYAIATNNCGIDTAFHNIHNFSVNPLFTTNYFYGMDVPTVINFTNWSSNSTSYFWDFGDNFTSNIEHPEHTYSTIGEYPIVLSASNQFCFETYQIELVFDSPNSVYIPNVFTPNGDDINDYFKIEGNNIKEIECKIFNRWGQELHTWVKLDGFWDGKVDSQFVSDGTYFYAAKIIWKNNIQEILRGHISILK